MALEQSSPIWVLTKWLGSVFEAEGRHWTVQQFFFPLSQDKTVRSGIRTMVRDEFGFVGFVNQRDLELLLGIKKPREWCHWLGAVYPELDSRTFFGVCCDEDDLRDELYEYERDLRASYGGIIPGNVQYQRCVHKDRGEDLVQLLQLLWDGDPTTGMYPDTRFETLESRWVRVEQQKWVVR